jgi:group I intron endonuclease
MGSIYKITNKLNGKNYIGQAQNVNERFKNHKSNAFCKNDKNNNNIPKLYNAFRKYGLDNFRFEIISDDIDNIQLDFWERFYICLYNSVDGGYNITFGGSTPLGIKRSEEFKRKMSESKKGTTASEETKEKLRKIMLGVKRSQETKDKMSRSASNKPKSLEHRKNLSNAKKGKPFILSEETKQKLKEINTKFIYTVVNPFGEISTTTNLDVFSKERGLEPSTMHKVANGKRKQYKGWTVPKKEKIIKLVT